MHTCSVHASCFNLAIDDPSHTIGNIVLASSTRRLTDSGQSDPKVVGKCRCFALIRSFCKKGRHWSQLLALERSGAIHQPSNSWKTWFAPGCYLLVPEETQNGLPPGVQWRLALQCTSNMNPNAMALSRLRAPREVNKIPASNDRRDLSPYWRLMTTHNLGIVLFFEGVWR